jgi:hypothetical protein
MEEYQAKRYSNTMISMRSSDTVSGILMVAILTIYFVEVEIF